MFTKLKKYLAKKLLPYVEFIPPKFETTSLDVETLSAITYVHNLDYMCVPTSVFEREVIRELSNGLKPYIKFEVNQSSYDNQVRIRGTIRVVKER